MTEPLEYALVHNATATALVLGTDPLWAPLVGSEPPADALDFLTWVPEVAPGAIEPIRMFIASRPQCRVAVSGGKDCWHDDPNNVLTRANQPAAMGVFAAAAVSRGSLALLSEGYQFFQIVDSLWPLPAN